MAEFTITDEVDLHLMRDALRRNRYSLLSEREVQEKYRANVPENPDYRDNEEWIARCEDLEKKLDAILDR